MMRPFKLLTLLLAIVLFATGCTASYWRSLLNTSGIEGVVATKGRLVWKKFEQEDGSFRFQVTKTSPIVQVSLLDGSSPVDIQTAKVDYFSPVGDIENAQYAPIDSIDTAIMPFLARLQGKDIPLNLGQIITNQLVDVSNPERGNNRLQDIDVQANVTFQGRNQFGSTITWQSTVPISIELE